MLRIDGEVKHPITLSLEDLRNHYQVYTVDTSYANDSRITQASYTGVRVWELLLNASVNMNVEHPEWMQVMARSADLFRCIVKWQEFAPTRDNNLILVAYLQNGQPIQGKHGPLRLVVPGDSQGLRYVSNLKSLTVLSVTLHR